MKRHILYVNADRGIPVWGESGGSAHIRDFVSAALRTGSDVTIVSARIRAGDASAPSAPTHKIKFSRYGAIFRKHWECCEGNDLAKEIRSFYANTVLSRQLPDMASKNQFSLVYERYSLFSVAGLNFARRNKLPYVLEVNSPLINEALKHRRLFMRELAESIARYLFMHADGVVAVSEEVAAYVRDVAPQARVTVMPNAVDTSRFHRSANALRKSTIGNKQIHKALPSLRDKFVIGYLGSFRPWHGLSNLLEAFAAFVALKPDAHLLIIGDGKALRPQLEKSCVELGVEKQVTFTGEAPNAEAPLYLSCCDTLVAPYPALENFYFSPLKVFEYMASGKPIIASNIGQLSRLLTDGENAALVPPGDVAALVAALVKVEEHKGFAERLAANAFDYARKYHSWDVRMSQMNELFDSLQLTPRIREAV